jgi:tetratricopeptide (TPR) repeat protein
MARFHLITRLSRTFRIAVAIGSLTSFVVSSSAVQTQSKDGASGTVQGTVRNSQKHPVTGAIVRLQVNGGTQTATATTGSDGAYLFSSLKQGTYTVRAEMSGYDAATLAPFLLKPGETKRIDLELGPLKSGKPQNPQQPEFFDEPQFTVAGVSDTTNFGGHGSDTVVRTTEALAKETLSLGGKSPKASSPSSSTTTSERVLRESVKQNPESFDANHELGAYLVAADKIHEGLPFLEKASRLSPTSYENAFQLTLAYANAGDYARARANVKSLLARQDKAELHHLLGDVEEKQGRPVEAVREYQRAAELTASEPNLFDWGAELLMHSAVEPAAEVFTKGNRLFPGSSRMLIGLGVAWYGRGSYDQAVQNLCQASDLNPADPAPYLFLGKLQAVDTTASNDSANKLARFARLQPENATANFYYAVSLWRLRTGPADAENSLLVESLLQKAVHLDPKLGPAFLQLGILYSERKDLSRAISSYERAIEASPRLEQAHYRLAQAYRQAGQAVKAQKELQTYEHISMETAEQVVRERRDIQQFVYTLRDGATAPTVK